ncbi:MAG: hypothetical protein LBF60_07005 [Treponema sp.]|jgi:hypothetical protein|nr:hypothetical protein [Treponema sp.]
MTAPIRPDMFLTLVGAPAVRLWPRYITDYFSPVDFEQSTLSFCIKIVTAGTTYEIDNLYISFDKVAPLPQRDVDALFQFELKYQAFGVPDHGGGGGQERSV